MTVGLVAGEGLAVDASVIEATPTRISMEVDAFDREVSAIIREQGLAKGIIQ